MKDDDKKINSNFETGANSNEINDLILFSDNTERLATLRDNIYKKGAQNNNLKFSDFTPLLKLAIIMYRNEFIKDLESYKAIENLNKEKRLDFCNLYLLEFNNWKKDNL